MPCSVSWRELIRILHLSSDAILDCLISEMAVTSVSIALAKSPGNTGYIFITGTDQHLFRTSDGRCILAKGRNGSHTHWRRVRDTAMNQQNNSGPGAGQVNTQTQVQFHSTAVHFSPATHTWSHLRTSRTSLMPSSAGWEAGQSASLAGHKNTRFRQFSLSEPLQQRTFTSLNCRHYLSVGYYYTLVGSIASS